MHAGSCTFRFEFVSIKTLDCRIYTKGEAQSHEKSRNRDTSRHFQSYFHWLQKQDAAKATWNTTIARSVGAQRSAQNLFQKLLSIFALIQYSLRFCLLGIYHRLHLGKRKRKRVIWEPIALPTVPRSGASPY